MPCSFPHPIIKIKILALQPSSIPVPEVEGLCSVVVWDSGLSNSALSCEDIIGYDVRLYHPELKHRNLTRHVMTDKTYFMVSDDMDINRHETLVQVIIYKNAQHNNNYYTSFGVHILI